MRTPVIALTFIVIGAALLTGCKREAPAAKSAPPAPTIAGRTFVRPVFLPRNGEPYAAGTAFGVRVKNHSPIILTAHHLFGPDGGLDRSIRARDLSSFLERVLLFQSLEEEDADPVAEVSRVITIPTASALGAQTGAGDIAAFWYEGDENALAWLRLADTQPREGDFVWLAAQVFNRSETQLLHPAVVRSVSSDDLRYEFLDGYVDITATSGAPILNQAGEVVGINVAATTNGANQTIGIGNPVDRFRTFLYEALGR